MNEEDLRSGEVEGDGAAADGEGVGEVEAFGWRGQFCWESEELWSRLMWGFWSVVSLVSTLWLGLLRKKLNVLVERLRRSLCANRRPAVASDLLTAFPS